MDSKRRTRVIPPFEEFLRPGIAGASIHETLAVYIMID
jgi:hypothetical protein